MTATTDRLNDIYSAHKDNCEGSFHNFLWQVMINQSLGDADAALFRRFAEPGIAIALGDGGYIPANFDAPNDVIAALNRDIFGLTPEEADRVLMRSMR